MAFKDAFSPDNINKIMSDPMVRIGMQLLAQSGPQAGNPGFGQRFAQAGAGFAQDQHQQQLQQMRQMQMQQAQAQQQQAAQLAQRLQDPAFQEQLTPQARQLAAAGADPQTVYRIFEMEQSIAQREQQLQDMRQHREGQLGIQRDRADAYIQRQQQAPASNGAQQPRQPAKRQVLEEPLPDGRVQKHIWDETTNSYRPYGSPYARSAGKGSGDPLAELLGDLPTGEPIPGLPGAAPLAQQMPQPLPQGADLLMNRGAPQQAQQPTRPMIAGGAVKGQANQGGPARPTTEAEFNALPKGALYIDPDDGRTYRK